MGLSDLLLFIVIKRDGLLKTLAERKGGERLNGRTTQVISYWAVWAPTRPSCNDGFQHVVYVFFGVNS